MTNAPTISYFVFLIFAGAAMLSTFALFTRQSLLIAYMALGAILGPWGFRLINNSVTINQAGDIGIIFLLFLLGLHLHPQSLFHSLRKMSRITFASSLIFWAIGFLIGWLFHFNLQECIIIGIAMMFSSTIIGIKLLPTTILHHQHTGELLISILLLQDLIAIFALLGLQGIGDHAFSMMHLFYVIGAFPILLILTYTIQRFIISKLIARFDKIHEYIFILSIGWCLFVAELAKGLGLSTEIGAFIGGVVLATNPISFYIAESLKPVRDFFLVLFFFAVGAEFNFDYLSSVIIPGSALAALILLIKPIVFSRLLHRYGEIKSVSWEIGVRLGQSSEFSLLVIYLASATNIISANASYMVQTATILTFIVSCYWVGMRYPTPLAASDKLRRD